jgi:hypothetical protein
MAMTDLPTLADVLAGQSGLFNASPPPPATAPAPPAPPASQAPTPTILVLELTDLGDVIPEIVRRRRLLKYALRSARYRARILPNTDAAARARFFRESFNVPEQKD